jgi:hypothetical protein
MYRSNFSKQLSVLIAMDMALTMVDSYVPHDWWPLRDAMACLVLTAMALTMAVTLRRLLEDY